MMFRRASSSGVFSPSVSQIFRFTTLRRFLPARWPAVIFAGLGLVMAVAIAGGETWRLRASQTQSMSAMVLYTARAAALNPFSRETREMAATLPAQMAQVPPMLALIQLRQALEDAPASPLLLWWFAATRLRAGDVPGARETLAELERVARDDPETAALRRAIETFERGKP